MTNRVLLVEDDLALRPFWELILKRQFNEYHLDWALSCEDAQRLITSSVKFDAPYTLIVTDLILAGSGTGADLVKFIGTNQKHTPLLLVSSTSEETIRGRYQDLVKNILVIEKPLSVAKCEKVFEKYFSIDLEITSPRIELWVGKPTRGS
jgi:DNA-binding NtrC family response regulator